MNLRDYTTVEERRKGIEKELKLSLPILGGHALEETFASEKNCENMIGAIQVPVGIAGPLKVLSSQFSVYSCYVPLATTEGALVASVNRGCKALSQSGGVYVTSELIGITRAPVFSVGNIKEGRNLIEWVEKNIQNLSKIAQETSSHLTLLAVTPWMVGRSVFLRFCFDSKDAMGMNMATIACAKMAEYIEAETKAKLVSLSGNVCVDKKPNALNFVLGRGRKVWAEAVLPTEIITSVLKTAPEKLLEVAKRKLFHGSILSASLGANAHAANILAAIFLATGQDVAHVAESAACITTIEYDPKGIYASIYIPDLVVGTVGGGTGLPTQKECLSILGISGGDDGKNSQKLAEIISAAVLAGEISLLASLSQNTLAQSHQKLGRGEK